MKTKIILTIAAGTLFLLGCTGTGYYPISGDRSSPTDAVHLLDRPDVLHY